MKKLYTSLFFLGSLIFLSVIGGSKANASVNQTIPNDYYYVSPISNPSLVVSRNMTLTNNLSPNGRFEFFYNQSKNAYLINEIPPNATLRWTGGLGLGNLQFDSSEGFMDDSYYWIIERVGNAYLLRNKKDPTMVWDVHNYQTTVGGRIKLEKEHSPSSPQREAQLFLLRLR
ncbi:hypothetical protein IGJ83_000048 [Enterococcus pernyi]|uniref:Ricin B lectin domain-containing protein n=1 Tax=Enterococcus mundtii TaxID=53346 RepID=A0A1V2UM78_ENTMU|nr:MULTISPECIES: hypothetical protein [Enterococcus]ONN44500.1 hypothetical protein BTN92_03505 [Enterococcus mundtii]